MYIFKESTLRETAGMLKIAMADTVHKLNEQPVLLLHHERKATFMS
jgi:hypothetical protein